jgi:hypothetical protein
LYRPYRDFILVRESPAVTLSLHRRLIKFRRSRGLGKLITSMDFFFSKIKLNRQLRFELCYALKSLPVVIQRQPQGMPLQKKK